MPSNKKSRTDKPTSSRTIKRASVAASPPTTWPGERSSSNGTHYEQPLAKDDESKEEREKRIKKREALTLKAFRMAYENHHQRKAS
jgi:hypothetical protein